MMGKVIQDSTMAEGRANIASSNTTTATAAAVASLDILAMEETTYQQTMVEENNSRPNLLSKTKSVEKKTKNSGTGTSSTSKTSKQGMILLEYNIIYVCLCVYL